MAWEASVWAAWADMRGPMMAPMRACRCCTDGQYEQAVGVALEGRRLDKLEEVVTRSGDQVGACHVIRTGWVEGKLLEQVTG